MNESYTGVDDSLLPIDAATGRPRPPTPQPGYYPGFSTLKQQGFWDETTRNLVLDRVENVPGIRFFSPAEARCLEAVFDRLLPQHDRDPGHRIPILNRVDARLQAQQTGGYRFEGMPPDGEAYRMGILGIDELAQGQYRKRFVELDAQAQDEVLKTLHDGRPTAAHAIWDGLPTHGFWTMMMQDAVEAYYAHPWAWDEIGFGGPAYPRGYMRLERGLPEPWEVREVRYEWRAPETSLSDRFEAVGGPSAPEETAGPGGIQ